MSDLTFVRLHLQVPLDPAPVVRLLTRLAQFDTPRPLVFETRADDDGIRYLIGTDAAKIGALTRLLTQHLPGARVAKASTRRPIDAGGTLTIRPKRLPVNVAASAAAIFNVHEALGARRGGEQLVIQVVIGSGHRPVVVPTTPADPQVSSLMSWLHGGRPANGETRARLRLRAEQATLDVRLRIGATAATAGRRRALTLGLLGALKTLEAPGVQIAFTREPSRQLDDAISGWRQLRLAADEILSVIGWPIGDGILPGLPSLHPKQLPAPASLSRDESVFGVTTAPGDERPIGIRAAGRMQHLVVTGPTGSGKSMVFAHLVLADIEAGRPCILLDPKRQLVDFILDHIPKDRIGSVVVLDAADPDPVGFNPLDTEGRNADVVVDGILAAFKAVFADGWGPRTEDLLHAGLLTLARAGDSRGHPFTLLDLPRLLTDGGFRRRVVGAVANDATLSSFWASYDELSAGARANIIAAPMNKLRKYLLRKNLAAVLGQSRPRFRVRDLFREGKTVLVPLNDALLGPGAAQLLGSLITSELWMATLERAAESNPVSRPAAIYIDEVQQFLNLPTSIADALATSRSYGVSWNLAHQFRAQLPSAMRAAFDANARNKIAFAAGADDARDLARMAAGLGREDFMSLPPYEVYAQVVDGGAPSGWFSARTLPPTAARGTRTTVLTASQMHFGSRPEVDAETPVLPSGAAAGHRKARRS